MNLPQTVPTLETPRLNLRAFTLEDAPAVEALMTDGKISTATLMIPHPYALEDAEGWIESHAQSALEADRYVFALTFKSGVLVGSFELMVNLRHARGELAYWLGTPFWGQGLNPEAGQAILDWGFSNLPLERVQAGVFANNPASARVQEKLGMTLEGRFREYYRKNGVQLDSEMRSILRREWEAGRSRV